MLRICQMLPFQKQLLNIPCYPVIFSQFCHSCKNQDFVEWLKHLSDKNFTSSDKKYIVRLYEFFIDFGVEPQLVKSVIINTPELVNYPIEKWRDMCVTMFDGGLSANEIFNCLSRHPDILTCNTQVLKKNLEFYREICKGNVKLINHFSSCPRLYFVNPYNVERVLNNLKKYFTVSEIGQITNNTPSVLEEKWEYLESKIIYINEVMCLSPARIAECNALNNSLKHIKSRHQFLFRAGLYDTPNFKESLSYKRNFPLSLIVDSSDSHFARRVAKLSDEEYVTFCQMLEIEMEEEEEEESDFEDDKDTVNGSEYILENY